MSYCLRLLRFAGFTVGGGSLFAALLAIPLVSAYSFLHPLRAQGADNPDRLGLEYEEVRLRGDDVELAAWFIPGRTPNTLVLVHGIHASRVDLIDLAGAMHLRGFSLFIPDMRAHGLSGGDVTTYGYRETQDLLAAIQYLKSRDDLKSGSLGLLGFSMGAVAVLRTAALSEDVTAVAADSGFALLSEQMTFTGQSLGPMAVLLPLIRLYGSWMGGIDVDAVAPISSVSRLGSKPALFIHGLNDQTIPPSNSQRLYDAATGPKELWLVPGAIHVQSITVAGEEYHHRVGDFFSCAFGPASC